MEIIRELEYLHLIPHKQTLSQNCNKRQSKSLCNDKGVIHQEDIKIISIYSPKIGAHKY